MYSVEASEQTNLCIRIWPITDLYKLIQSTTFMLIRNSHTCAKLSVYKHLHSHAQGTLPIFMFLFSKLSSYKGVSEEKMKKVLKASALPVTL